MHRAVLRPGQRLQCSRQLAERIGVSRNTVSLAYDARLADGYLSSRSRSGVYVAADVAGTRIGASRRRRDPESPLAARLAPEPEDSGFRCPQHWHRSPFPFIAGRVDAQLTTAAEWGAVEGRAWCRGRVGQDV